MAQQITTTTISDATRQCVNAFSDVLLRAVSGYEVPDLAMIKEHHARFSIWAEELGVSPKSNSSPEYRLHDVPDIKNVIVKLLQQLKTNVEVISSLHPVSQILNKPEETNDDDEYSSDSSLGISEDDYMERELELVPESHFATNKHTQVIGEIISHLYRFTSMVKQQYVHAEDHKMDQWVLEEGQQLEEQLKGLELYMSYSLESDFPTLQPFLRNRLINTVIQRRKRLLYQEECFEKLESSVQGSSNTKGQELASGHPDVQDIRPYICLFQNCNTPLQQFTAKSDWINHMSSQHAQVWVCQVKGHETWLFQNPANLKTHLQKEHSDIVKTDQISLLTVKSARPSSDILGALATENIPENSERLPVCPFCNLSASVFEPKSQLAAPGHRPTAETSQDTYQKAHDHISEHLKLIAHESLPPALQKPKPISLSSFKFAIICGRSSFPVGTVSGLFNQGSYMNHPFQGRISEMNSYSLAAIGRHNVVRVHIEEVVNCDLETLLLDIRRSFPCIELFVLVDAYPINPPPSNKQINFGDVIVGDRVKETILMRSRHPYYSKFIHKPGARVRSLLAKMRTPQVQKMVQQRISTNPDVLEEYQSLAATYRSTGYKKNATQRHLRGKYHKRFFYLDNRARQSNGDPKPRFHFGAIESRTWPLKLHSSRSTVTVAESHDLDFNTENTETSAIYDPMHHILIPKNEDFVERQTSMKALEEKLFRDGREQVTILGADGNGKTQLVLWLAYWVKDNMQNYSVFWAAAVSAEAFEQDCRRIVESLGYRCTGGNDPKVVLQRYLNSDSSGRWILILHEASDEDLTYGQCDHPFEISKFLPNSRKGRILVTTESKEVAWVGDAVVTLSYMNDEESLNLLSRSLINKSHDKTLMKELLQIVPSHPPVISMAAAYININKVTLSSYLGILKDAERSANSLLDISDTRLSLCSTFDVSFEHIEKHHDLAAKILLFVSFFEPNTIPSSILPGTENVQKFNEAIHILRQYQFVKTQYDAVMIDIRSYVHRAIQIWVKNRDSTDHYRGAVAAHLVQVLTPNDSETRQLWNQHLPKVLHLITHAKHFHRDTSNLGCLVVRHLHQDGRVGEAIKVFEGLLDSQSGALSEDEAYYLTLEFELAGLYRLNSQTQKAIDLLEHVVATRDRTLAESHPYRLASQNELARAYEKNGQHKQAIKILEHLTSVREKIGGVDDPELLVLQHQLAYAYLSTGKLDEGNELLEHITPVKGRSSSDAHP
ncbi:hypothetical protein HYE67_000230 [Fusarium culmorum]|uniref:NB-ARC domain-containing protein n=1 Tax=Fusarium culmorum TaxID=5516 RepID=A0A7S8HRM1_FUSCU|nr:hypothetical protein HYE67_000230 [Fusarium culmorum]